MIAKAPNHRLTSRILRNLIVTIAVTAIFALSTTKPNAIRDDYITLAAR